MEQFKIETIDRLRKIQSITEMLTQVHHQRQYSNGSVREAYTEVLRTELFRMMKEVDDFKLRVCQELTDIEAERIMSLACFPFQQVYKCGE